MHKHMLQVGVVGLRYILVREECASIFLWVSEVRRHE